MPFISTTSFHSLATLRHTKGKPFNVDLVTLEPPKTFADAKKVHSSILEQKIVYNPIFPKGRDRALLKAKERLVARLNSTLKLKPHWTCEFLSV